MADIYATEFVGGPDGTASPPKKLDGRLIGAKERRIRATKPAAAAFAVGDRLYIGKVPQGGSLRGVSANFDTAFGPTTVSIGTTANPIKYVNGKTVSVVDAVASIGPRAAASIIDPLTVDEDLWATFGGAALPAGITGVFELTYTTAN